ncbi:hypothetical protein [Massilia aquatica]|uniref:Outer membrane protein assembly factor BamE n=1 Tax=Massilia aquatica TaxID=2609000 RepID=A0ABX0LUW9_9BURK|nr:hypothetical protein [Massilia aquatica]NHZ38651.1 hypothetical protein [Massilia aquatica]
MQNKLSIIRKGMDLAKVQSTANITSSPISETIDSRTFSVIKFPADGVQIFFDKNVVSSVRFERPFSEAVEGVRLGSSKDEVVNIMGKPDRLWPIDDGVERWLYDKPTFMRLDFDPLTNVVSTIFR